MRIFELTDEEEELIDEWRREHECPYKYHDGAIGGRISYVFTPTGIGVVMGAECACGSKIDVTNYEDW
jgi:hypothetical protein